MYAKTKELGPVGGVHQAHPLDPPMIREPVADPGGPGPLPLLKLVKKDGCHTTLQVSRVIGAPSDKFLDPLLGTMNYWSISHLFQDMNNQTVSSTDVLMAEWI